MFKSGNRSRCRCAVQVVWGAAWGLALGSFLSVSTAVSAAGDPAIGTDGGTVSDLIQALGGESLDEAKREQLEAIGRQVDRALGVRSIRWRSAGDEVFLPQAPGVVANNLGNMLTARERRHVVVQFSEPVDDARRAALDAAGLRLQSALGDNAFFAVASSDRFNPGALANMPSLQMADTVRREHKLHRLLLDDAIPEYSITGQVLPTGATQPVDMVAVYAVFHRDVTVAEATAVVQEHGGVVKADVYTVNTLVVELPRPNIDALADADDVQWLEPPLPRMGFTNDSNRALTGADTVQTAPYNLDGSNVNVLVYDGGTALSSHSDFGGRLTVRDSAGLSDHATHVSGTVGGDGSQSGGTNRGMAPAVTIQSYGFEWDGSDIFLYSNPGDIQADYDEAINTYGAEISNNSIGSNVETNGWPCEIQGDYGVTSALIDAIVGGSLGDPFRVVWAAGNERQGSSCDIEGFGDYYSLAPPSTAKNHIAVAAVNSNDDSMTSFSSWGPTDDGRLKPDVAGPGCQSNGDDGVTSTASNGGYNVKCGTSMAAPTVTGLSALLMEDFKAQYPGQTLFRNSTLKAWLAHSAVDRGNPGPDYQFGYGSVRIQEAIDLMRSGTFLEDSVSQGATFTRTVVVNPGDSELRVTLAWDDAPGTPNVDPALVNDLDLRVFDPSSGQSFPWTLDPQNPGDNAVQNQADRLNNIEQVLVNNPAAGTWTIEVHGFSVPQGPQSFSLIGDGAVNSGLFISLPNGSPSTTTPATPQVIDVQVSAIGESIVGTPTLHFRDDGGAYQTSSLTNLGGDLYEATIPGVACGQVPEWYFSAQGSLSGTVTLPTTAPTNVYTMTVGTDSLLFEDDFETDTGWTAENLGASSGDWQRGVPVDDNGWDHDPASDSDGSGQCLLTQNETGNTDVDSGSVRITSPSLDLSAGSVSISYDYYLKLTNDNGIDQVLVEMSSNGLPGPWTTVAVHDTDGGLSWRPHTITQGDLDAAGVTLTSTMRIRYTANDDDPQSIVEAGVDAVRIDSFTCSSGVIEGACCFDDGSCTFGTPADCSSAGGTYQGDDVSCASANCPQPGACCFDDGSCTFGFASDCSAGGGSYQGDGVSCASANCPQPGACCFDDGSCTFGFSSDCSAGGGNYQGDGVSCASANCPQPGACCLNDGVCSFGFATDCTSLGGDYQGDGVACAAASCPQPGACCFNDGSCTFGFETDCTGAGGTFQGEGVSCASANCPQPGACCFDDGSCTFGFATDCTAGGGSYQGDGVTCAAANCEQPGACCFDDGSCTFGFASDCAAGGGSYQGDNVSCASANCPQPGACCFDDGSCTFGFASACAAGGGSYQGDNVSCASANCPQPGACCFDDGSCTFGFAADCAAGGGSYQGDNVSCASANCPQPGACCFDDGSCTFGFATDCTAGGGSYQGDGVTCAAANCEQPGACCFDDGSCTFGFASDCAAGGGSYQGDNVSCASANCPQPGACCFDDGSCTFGFATDCTAGGGSYQGDGVTCAAANCEQPGACCFDDGSCTFGFASDCSAGGGSYQGDGVTCAAANCEQPGACCFDDGSCTFGFASDCSAGGGTYQGDNVSCASANCPQPGACCFDDGSCTFGFASDCSAGGGTYQGDGVTCAAANCEQPGACCLGDGSCTFGFASECAAGGGSYQGDNVSCASASCEQPGACCFDDGSCTFGFAADCTAGGGAYQGDNVSCASANCPQPGACCFDDGSCSFGFASECATGGGTYQGDGVSCAAANCEQPGACCLDDGTCTFGIVGECVASGGAYQGDNVSCASSNCPQPGACCFDDGSCSFDFETDCLAAGGAYQGDGVDCIAANCPQPGACCYDDGLCTFDLAADCSAAGGSFQGAGIDCATANCPQPGACCFDDGSCTFGLAAECAGAGGSFVGGGIDCASANCPQPGACCFDDGSCSFGLASDCTAAGGAYAGDGIDCVSADCPQPGACCFGDGNCTFGPETECTSAGGTFLGGDCVNATCTPPCPEDLDGSGDVGFSDILQLIGSWGPCAGCPADLDGSGDVGFSDILAVIAAWGACP